MKRTWLFGILIAAVLILFFPFFAVRRIFLCERKNIPGSHWFALIAFAGFGLITLAVVARFVVTQNSEYLSQTLATVIAVIYLLVGWFNIQLLNQDQKPARKVATA